MMSPPPTAGRAPRAAYSRRRVLGAAAALPVLAGCSLAEPVDTSAVRAVQVDPDARVIRFAHPYDPAHAVEATGVATVREALAEHGFSLESYPSAQLGGEGETAEQVATGGLELAVVGPSFLGVWHAPAAVLDAAYLFTSVDQFDAATTGAIMRRINDETAAATGLRAISTWFYGNRHVTANREIMRPEDLQGLKIRTPDAPLYLINFGIMGGTPTPMALSEAYLGLQQGAIDAQENPIPTIEVQKFYEVQKVISLTGHCVQGINIVTSDRFLESLSGTERQALEDALELARGRVRDRLVAQEQEILDAWRTEHAIEINDQVDVAAFQELVSAQLPDRVPWGDLYLEIQESVR